MSTIGESKVGNVTYVPRLPSVGVSQESSDGVVFLGDTLFQQGRFQTALSQCTRALLQHASTDIERTAVLNQALAPLVAAAGAMRAGIFENYTDEQQQFLSRLISEATSPGVPLTLGIPGFDRIPWRADHVAQKLQNGDSVQGLLAEIGKSEDVKVFLFLPIHVNQKWWGYIAFGDSDAQRVWSENEILLLRTAAEIISNFLNRVQVVSALHDSEELFRLSFDKSPIGAAMLSLSKRFLRVNQPFCQITGYTETELLARTFPEITHPDDVASGLSIADKFVLGEMDQYQTDKRYVQKNGDAIWTHVAVQMVRNVDGKPLYLLEQIEDISERRQLARQAQLQTAIANCSRALMSSTEDISRQLLVLTNVMEHLVRGVGVDRATIFRNRNDPAGIFCLDMQAEACATGCHAQIGTDINHAPWTWFPDEMRQSLSSKQSYGGLVADLFSATPQIRDALLAEPLLSVLFCPIHFGDEWWGFMGFADCHEKRVWDEQEVVLLRTVANMVGNTLQRWQAEDQVRERTSHLQQSNDRLEEMQHLLRDQALRDPLTGLINRRYLIETLEREIARSVRHQEPLSLMMFDMDYFKMVNDLYGHLAGDEVLRYMSQLLLRNTRKSDVVCRFGGEEFVVLMPQTARDDAHHRAEEWRIILQNTLIQVNENRFSVTVSIGIATNMTTEISSDALLTKVDQAMYAAKRAGRNCTVAWE